MSPATRAPTDLIDSDHPAVTGFAAREACGADDRERAVALYYAVRDGFRYDPYRIDLSPAGMRASTVLALGYGWPVAPPAFRPGSATPTCATISRPSACAPT
jgi:transglutaminase-like putative cysteine protease